MSVIGSNIIAGASGTVETGYQIARSLRFNSADSAYLNRTPGTAGNRKTWTMSFWIKRTKITDDYQRIFSARGATGELTEIVWNNETSLKDNLVIENYTASVQSRLVTTPVYRDVSAWYHVLIAYDTTQATSTNRVRVYINNVEVTSFASGSYPAQNVDTYVNSTFVQKIGTGTDFAVYLNAYLADFYLIDGQALTPSSFGQTDSATGVWVPKTYTGTYGTNGFWLKLDDNSGVTATTLGKDSSGNSNNWTPNNFSVTAGAGNDSLVDSPTNYGTDTGAGGEVRGNYCTWNPLNTGRLETLANGNLDASIAAGSATGDNLVGTLGISSGKWYWETVFSTTATPTPFYGYYTGISVLSSTQSFSDLIAYGYDGTKANLGSTSAYGATWVAGDVIGVALDMTAGTIAFYKNGVSQGTAISGLTGTVYPGVRLSRDTGYGTSVVTNFGQRPFAYTAPSGFKALCTQNLPTPAIGASASTLASKNFNVITYAGNGNTSTGQAITGNGFQPDFLWIKNRGNAVDHVLMDAVRGAANILVSNSTNAESNYGTAWKSNYGSLVSFDTDGFTAKAGTVAGGNFNDTGYNYVGWSWKANGAGSSNTAGSITSTVSANTTAGISVITYTGTGTGGATVGHGLGVAPKMIITKARVATGLNWAVYHASLGATKNLWLSNTDAVNTQTVIWNDTAPSSTVFTVGSSGNTNSTQGMVAYCFAEVEGFSKFGSYAGNASTDGPFVYCGFRPRFVFVKRTDTTGDWVIHDTARSSYNQANAVLYPNLSNAEDTSFNQIDILSNGFKCRSTNTNTNASSGTYIFMALAENPFNYSRAR